MICKNISLDDNSLVYLDEINEILDLDNSKIIRLALKTLRKRIDTELRNAHLEAETRVITKLKLDIE